MYNRKHYIALVCLIFLMAIVPMISAQPPFETDPSNTGLIVQPTIKEYLRTGMDHEFEVHIFNLTNGNYITDATCYMHPYDKSGEHLFEGFDDTVSHNFDYSFDLNGTNFTQRGEYSAKFQCNNSAGDGDGVEIFFHVNDYGEELSEAESHTFNMSMIFLMALFVLAIIGIFSIDHYIAKFSLYWVAHVLFIVGTFSVWQFNQGYAIGFVGLASVWKILFYVSTIAVLPMFLLSLAWIFYIHAFNEHFQKLVDKGVDTEEAFRLTQKKRGGWFNGV